MVLLLVYDNIVSCIRKKSIPPFSTKEMEVTN